MLPLQVRYKTTGKDWLRQKTNLRIKTEINSFIPQTTDFYGYYYTWTGFELKDNDQSDD